MECKIITLYNTGRYYSRSSDEKIVKCNDYIEYRLELFKNTCLRSIEHQTDRRFKWLVFTDLSLKLSSEFVDLCNSVHDNIEIIDMSYSNDKNQPQEEYFQKILCDDGDIAEFKLDSDDCINKDFVKIVLESCQPDYYKVYYPNKLYTLSYPDMSVYKNFNKKRNFPIIIKSNNSINNIYEKRHNEYYNISNSIIGPFYLYTRHDKNHCSVEKLTFGGNYIKTIQFTKNEKEMLCDQFPWIEFKWIM